MILAATVKTLNLKGEFFNPGQPVANLATRSFNSCSFSLVVSLAFTDWQHNVVQSTGDVGKNITECGKISQFNTAHGAGWTVVSFGVFAG